MPLPVNIENLLSGRSVENERIEFKEGWNPPAIYRSVCAFANDFSNIGGGYVIIGVKANDGIPERPVKGIPDNQIDNIQQQMIGFNNLIRPIYHAKLDIEEVDGNKIMILWVPGGSNRPYEVPEDITSKKKEYHYYIRKYASSVKAGKQEREELIGLANQVPFDDRANTDASLDDISFTLLKDHLRITKSKLQDWTETRSKADILEQMELLSGPPEQLYPRNVALMTFSEKPERFFPYSRVELVFFPKGAADPEFKEIPPISGPVPFMIKETLSYLKTHVLEEKIRKVSGQPESVRVWNYPYTALEEAVANALYHRDYQLREPVEIRIYPDSITILNYGGPDRSIKLTAFNKDVIKPRRYRNRRLGDFLKELDLTEGRATGIPTIRKVLDENGSPDAFFDTDDDRSFFEATLFIHPDFIETAKTSQNLDDTMTEERRNDDSKISEEFRKNFGRISERISERIRREFGKVGKEMAKTFEILVQHPEYSAEQIASEVGKTSRTIESYLLKLKKAGIIVRKGPKLGGHWEIVSE